MNVTELTVRVYGLLIHQGRILVADEVHFGVHMTKFPGGGLVPGEGTIECLKRECREELGVQIEVVEHFYTTDYFQPTWFLEIPRQLISIYYLINTKFPEQCRSGSRHDDMNLRWINMDELTEADVTLPVDKRVVGMLIERREEKGERREEKGKGDII